MRVQVEGEQMPHRPLGTLHWRIMSRRSMVMTIRREEREIIQTRQGAQRIRDT